jgi:iron complex outermembrane receptor protein
MTEGGFKRASLALLAAMLGSTEALAQEEVSNTSPAPATAADPEDKHRVELGKPLDPVVVRGGGVPKSSPSAQVLFGEELVHKRQGGLGETLSGMPGIHMDNFGGGASRPVIRGQTLPRIEILSDGAPIFDASSVSPDHAITTEPLLLDSIEVLRGPAALVYGGNAVNGAVNLIDSKIPKALPSNGLAGDAEVRFGTGDNERTAVARLTTSWGPFAFHVEGADKNADDYRVPSGFGTSKLKDSFADSSTHALGASWISAKGYIGAAFSSQSAYYGLPGHSHANGVCHNHGTSLHCQAHGSFGDPFAGYDDSHSAYIRLKSERADVRADYDDILPGISHFRLRFSDTNYRHDEHDGDIVPAWYTNKAQDTRIELTHIPVAGFVGTFGFQYTEGRFDGLNISTAHLGSTSLSDVAYHTKAWFITERRQFGPFELALGARSERRRAEMEGWSGFFPAYDETPFSASVEATWNVDSDHSLRASFTRSQRAPSVRELYAGGNNLATNSFEVGLANKAHLYGLEPRNHVLETAKSFDLTLTKHRGPTRYQVSTFQQTVDDYVYADLLDIDEERNHRFLLYSTANVRFTGVEGEISHQVTPTSRAAVFGDYVRAKLLDRPGNLPRIPPARLGTRYDWNSGPWTAGAEFYRTLAQNKVGAYESPTPGYNMLNATVSFQFDHGHLHPLEVYLRGTNLTDQLAYEHSSFVKEQSPR